MTPEDIKNMTDQTYTERVSGSKWVFVSEHSFILCVWALKACMLVIYARITYVDLESYIAPGHVLTISSARVSSNDAGLIISPSMSLSVSSPLNYHSSLSVAH